MNSSTLDKSKKLKTIVAGIAVRLFGLCLIWLGEGHDSFLSKALVICGLIISVVGIGILRFLLLSPLFSKVGAKIKGSQDRS